VCSLPVALLVAVLSADPTGDPMTTTVPDDLRAALGEGAVLTEPDDVVA
jgi:hypothetical protein